MAGQWRVTAWCGRLLLFAALVFGIVAMHSLGHCAEHPASPASGSGAAAHHGPGPAAMTSGRMSPMPLTHGTVHADGAAAGQDSDATAADTGPARLSDGAVPRAHAPLPPGGTDPAAVCLAVLTAASLVLLGAAFARRSADGPAGTLARLPHALRPIPPPPHGILLARASVLRL